MQDKDYLIEELKKSKKSNQDLNDQLTRLKAQLSAMHIQQKSINNKKSVENDINISNENFINALNKQIARLKSDNKNLEMLFI